MLFLNIFPKKKNSRLIWCRIACESDLNFQYRSLFNGGYRPASSVGRTRANYSPDRLAILSFTFARRIAQRVKRASTIVCRFEYVLFSETEFYGICGGVGGSTRTMQSAFHQSCVSGAKFRCPLVAPNRDRRFMHIASVQGVMPGRRRRNENR